MVVVGPTHRRPLERFGGPGDDLASGGATN